MTNLLNPAPPEIERLLLLEQSFERLGPGALRAAQSFSKAIEPVLDALRKLVEVLDSLCLFDPPSYIQPSIRYALHGWPYSKNTKGKKKWLREMRKR